MKLGLEGKSAVITGGSRGIGLEVARLLAREGAEVLICGRRQDALDEAVTDIRASEGRTILVHAVDVTKLADLDALPEVIGSRLGGIDLLVNNAGTGTYKPFLEVTEEELQYGTAINFFAQFRMCQRIIPLMMERGGGSIVNVTGESGIRVFNPPFLSACTGPSKAAENRLTKILANEFAPSGIRVNAVVPGFVSSPERVQKWKGEIDAGALSESTTDTERQAHWSMLQGMREPRWGRPEEIASLIVFALSDAASYINGAVLVADGTLDKS